jgi:hypothetical protein
VRHDARGRYTPPAGRPVVLIDEATPATRVAHMRRVAALAQQCGIWGGVRNPPPTAWTHDGASAAASIATDRLREGARKRARETWDLGRLATALEYLVEVVDDTKRAPFMPLRYIGEIEALVHNQETLEMLAEHIRVRGSRQPGQKGRRLKSDTVDTYVSAIKTFVSFETHYEITATQVNVVMPRAAKRSRQTQGPPGTRKLSRGMRAHMLVKLVALGYNRGSARMLMRWAAGLAAHNLLLRGGELGLVTGWTFDPSRDATFGAIEFKEPCADSEWRPWLTWDVVPVKDKEARNRICPMAVRRRQLGGAEGADAMCLYDAIRMHWRAATGREPPAVGRASGAIAQQPIFIGRYGDIWDTRDTKELAQEYAEALGLDTHEFGAKAFRIGGALDWRDVFKHDAERIITERGRWHSDIGVIYARALAEAHLRGSAAVGDATGADLESLCAGWAQPATFR